MRSQPVMFSLLTLCIAICTPLNRLVSDEMDSLRVPIEIVAGEGCMYEAQSARMLDRVAVPGADGLIAIEAEDAVRFFYNPAYRDPEGPPTQDAEASNGRCTEHLTYARYPFVSPQQQWTLWVRVATPKGRSRFLDSINGQGFAGPFVEEHDESAKPYHWVRRGAFAVQEGWNRLEFVDYHAPFPKLDKLVLSPSEWTPSGLGPEPQTRAIHDGWVETADVQIPGLRELATLEGVPQNGADLKLSCDSGETWREIPRDRFTKTGVDLRNLAIPRGAPVRLSVTMRRADGHPSPAVGPLWLRAKVDRAECIQLQHGSTRIVFDGTTGGLFLMENTKTGDAVIAPGRARPIIALDFKRRGERKWMRVGLEEITPRVAQPGRRKGLWEEKAEEPRPATLLPQSVQATPDRLEVTYTFAASEMGSAKVSYVVEPAGDGVWRFAAAVQPLEGPADVVAVVFPIFEHVRIGPSGLDDHQLRLQSFGHHVVQPGKGTIRDTSYLGSVVMPWTEVYDERTGFYLGSHDPEATNTLFCSRAGGRTAEFFHMWTEKRHQITAGESRTWEYAVATHPGDWHWGADRYREWFYRTHGQAQYPLWMHTCDGWLNLQAENYGREFRFDRLPAWLTLARAVGMDWIQVWGQFSHDGGTCCAAFYAPSPLYGGAEGWKQAVRTIRQRRGRIGGYFVYDRTDILPLVSDWFLGHFKRGDYPPDTPWPTPEFVQRLRLIADPAGVVSGWPPRQEEVADYLERVDEHQRLYAERQRAMSIQWMVKTYINDPEWRDFLKLWIVDKYVKEYGCNTVYIDVLGCGGASESFDPRRKHNGDGTWGKGKSLLAKHVVEAARQAVPDFGPTMEGIGDMPGLYCASMASGVYRGGRNVLRYALPERILLHGTSNPGSGGTPVKRFLETFLEGMRFDIVGRPTSLPVYLLQLQRQFTSWLYMAKFLDTAGLKVSNPRVKARLFLLQGDAPKGALVTIANHEYLHDVEVALQTATLGDVRAAFVAQLDGTARRLPLQRDAGSVSFVVPPNPAATVLLVAEDDPKTAVWPVIHLKRDDPPALQVTLLNLTGKEQHGTCEVENIGFTEPFEERMEQALDALPFEVNKKSFLIKPWEAKTVQFPLRSLQEHEWTVRVRVSANIQDGAIVRRAFFITPLVLDGSFEFREAPVAEAPHGECALTFPPSDVGYQHRLVDFWLEPSRRYKFRVLARRSGVTAKVSGTLLMVNGETEKVVWKRYNLDRTRPNEWQALSDVFETPPDLTRAAIYLYNVMSPDIAWFDDLRVEDLGPVGK